MSRLRAAFPDCRDTEQGVEVDITSTHIARVESTGRGLRVFLTRHPQHGEDENTVPSLELGDHLSADDAVALICTAISLL